MANTINIIGDAKLTDSIIDKSITEYEDNIVSNVGDYVFYKCTDLNTIKLPNATSVGDFGLQDSGIIDVDLPLVDTLGIGAFSGCKNLVKLVLPSLNKVGIQPFNWCTKLEHIDIGGESFSGFIDNNACKGTQSLKTVILRKTNGVCALSSNTCFDSDIKSPINNGTGYFYVPSSLVDRYKSDSIWSKFANQIRAIEDYPEVCDPYTWESVFKCIDNGTYKDVYKIGDTVPLDLGSEGVINMQIAAFDTDDLADGSGKAPITWISKELLKTKHIWNPALVSNGDGTYQEGTGNVGGWEKCELRRYLNDTIKPLISDLVSNMIVTVNKTQTAKDINGTRFTQTTADEIWVIGETEAKTTYNTLFPDNKSRLKRIETDTSYQSWSTRDCEFYNCGGIILVTFSGSVTDNSGNYKSHGEYGIALCFCT